MRPKNGDVVFGEGDRYVYWCDISQKYIVQHLLGSVSFDDAVKFSDLEEAKKYCLSDENKPL